MRLRSRTSVERDEMAAIGRNARMFEDLPDTHPRLDLLGTSLDGSCFIFSGSGSWMDNSLKTTLDGAFMREPNASYLQYYLKHHRRGCRGFGRDQNPGWACGRMIPVPPPPKQADEAVVQSASVSGYMLKSVQKCGLSAHFTLDYLTSSDS